MLTSMYILMKTMAQKYAFSASPTKIGAKTTHHEVFASTPSTFRVRSTVKTRKQTSAVKISKAVRPSHLRSSFRVRNILIS